MLDHGEGPREISPASPDRFGHNRCLLHVGDASHPNQYNATVITKSGGDVIMGRIVNLSGDEVMVNTNMLDPNAITNVKRGDIESMEPSKVSMMPPALLSTLKEDDVLDLLAYLLSAGDPENELFQ